VPILHAVPRATEELPRPAVDVAWFELFALTPGGSSEGRHWDHKQIIGKTVLHKAILDPPVSFYGTTQCHGAEREPFVKYTYPIPKEEGGTEIRHDMDRCPC